MPPRKAAPEKRIPVGTIVKFKARYDTDPEWTGKVINFYPGSRATYRVHATHRDGQELGTRGGHPVYLTPYASRMEAQNPSKLRKV